MLLTLSNYNSLDLTQLFLLIITFVLSMVAQTWVQTRYSKYKNMPLSSSLTGYQVAQRILDKHHINYITLQENPSGGVLSDHFNPQTNVVNLSKDVFYGTSIASASIAAHEIGHVIQYHQNFSFIGLRNKLLPMAMTASGLGWTVLMIGLMSGIDALFLVGLAAIAVIGLFQLITLPIEFDASKRAINELQEENILNGNEVSSAKGMLNAAAFTYVAAFLGTLATILRLFLMRGSRRRD